MTYKPTKTRSEAENKDSALSSQEQVPEAEASAEDAPESILSPELAEIRPIAPPEAKAADIGPEDIPNYGLQACECLHCQQVRKAGSQIRLNHGPHKNHHELGHNEFNRISQVGDLDYVGADEV